MSLWRRGAAVLLALALSACATLSPAQRDRAGAIVAAARPQALACDRADACAQPSPLRELAARAFAESRPDQPRHYALILDKGPDALLARVNLIRSATTAIDLQTYIFDEDDAGRLVLDELIAAARRGVRVRVLIDQLAALKHVDTLAALAGVHANFELRLYNPVLGRAQISYPKYALAAACCWRRLNQRMHTKLLLVDGAVGITGGRNYQDDYYDWDDEYNFRDRDLLVAGPVARQMSEDFARFWDDRRSVPVERLNDVGRRVLEDGVPALPPARFERPQRAEALRRDVADGETVRRRLAEAALPVGRVRYISDTPDKHRDAGEAQAPASDSLRGLIESAREEVLLQTPYLVLSKSAQGLFRELRRRPPERRPRVIVSTNSLAATDAFIAYALSYKYKRRYLREFGFNIYEYKPFPLDAPIDLAATGAPLPEFDDLGGDADPQSVEPARALTGEGLEPDQNEAARRARRAAELRDLRRRYDRNSVVGREQYRRALSREYGALRYASRRVNQPVPLKRAGVRIGLHAKSLVIDERIGVVGTHNFDPRGDHYNTESAVVIEDPAFARALAASIRRDIAPANSWVIARRDKPVVLSGLTYSLGKLFEAMPVLDFWPMRYATSYEFVPGPDCPQPLLPSDPNFRACYRPVGDFPEVALGLKGLTTRIFTAFGAGLAPIL
ncbi:phospholipase D-like protein [Vulcaniibacterium tengchongense]|uniref:Phospholipase D-like protein n=2 Tax=Vulcaniibacterium tengchongense TaxID=1273429 RepID=A0A3N4VJY9_9GAMM|nr:phospholipase D family protein [Vulcaniibacterium tengchongense]RPE80059.1 phospholipase D-like protein [Vulcaniibacterium tengchongense]